MTRQQRHFTLVEILVVMVIISIILGLTFPAFFRLTHSTAVDQAGRMVAAQLSLARAEAIAKRRPVAVIMPGNNWCKSKDDQNEPQPYRFSSFRSAYVEGSGSTYTFQSWVPGTSWTFLPKGAVIAQCDHSSSELLNGVPSGGCSANDYRSPGNPIERLAFTVSDTSETLSIIKADGNGEIPADQEVRAIVFNSNGSLADDSYPTYITIMAGIVPQGDVVVRNSHSYNIYVLEVNQFTGKARMMFPARKVPGP